MLIPRKVLNKLIEGEKMKELIWIKENKRDKKIKLDLMKVDAYFIMGVKKGKKNINYYNSKAKGLTPRDMSVIIRMFYELFKGRNVYKPLTYLKRG